MLFVHDVHAVIGEREFEFRDLVQEQYAPNVADDDTRLLWYLHSSHGSGEAYHAVMITAVRDGAAWERLCERLRYGALSSWLTEASTMRYGSTSTLLVATPWSPFAQVDLESIPITGDNPVRVYREDILRGPGVVDAVGASSVTADPGDILRPVAAFEPALGSGDEVRILYGVAPFETFAPSFGADAGWGDWPGSLTPTLPDRCSGTGRYVQTTPWSPLG